MGINIKINDLVQPYFVTGGRMIKEPIPDFPGIYRFSADTLLCRIADSVRAGIGKILLFGIPADKDNNASGAFKRDGVVPGAVRKIKLEFPDLTVMTDICLCAYTKHGHCGIVKSTRHSEAEAIARPKNLKRADPSLRPSGFAQDDRARTFQCLRVMIDKQKTLSALAKMALVHAEAGADWVAPSAMAARQVYAIRNTLDSCGYDQTRILGYSAKFASNFYGPFRNAAGSAPKFGDRSGYQLSFNSQSGALNEIRLDIKEGADAVMVKPALAYLDIIKQAAGKFNKPLFAYNVSGEYAMVKFGAHQKLWEEEKMVFEILTAIKRAGADFIITYHAGDVARWLS